MRLTTFPTLLAGITTLAAACVGEVGGSRKPGPRDPATTTTTDATCAKLEKDVVIRTAADMTALPKTGCYDIYGKLTLQGSAVTSLAGLNGLNSVNELDLDHTSLTAIDTQRPVGIYGKLTVTGNTKLTNLKQLSFETASTGILIDGNTVLASLEPLGLDQPKLEEVDGDIAITGNPALISVPLGHDQGDQGDRLADGVRQHAAEAHRLEHAGDHRRRRHRRQHPAHVAHRALGDHDQR